MEFKINSLLETNKEVTIEITNCNGTGYSKKTFTNEDDADYFYRQYRETVRQGFLKMYIY